MTRAEIGRWMILALPLLAGCPPSQKPTPPVPPPDAAVVRAAPPEAKPAADKPAADKPAVAAPTTDKPAADKPAAAKGVVLAPGGQDFIKEAKILFRVAACAGNDPIPANLSAKVVDQHCAAINKRKDDYTRKYIGEAKPFIAALRPPDLPTTVVYPFGGGDLLSALTTYPDATEITTLSLEYAGDPRRIDNLDAKALRESLDTLRRTIDGLLALDDSTTENLQKMQHCDIPGQVAFFLVALAVHGYEPVSLRYFRLEPEGAIHYLDADDIAALEKKMPRQLSLKWQPPDHSVAFSNVEMSFRPIGQPDAPLRVHRHIAANLGDSVLEKNPQYLRHLEIKGRVSAMTKAASYLLWNLGFTKIRDYLLKNMAFMISDSTGIPNRYAKKAGFVQETYGRFEQAFIDDAPQEISDEFKELWAAQPARKLPFRYGYQDFTRKYHLLITRPAKK